MTGEILRILKLKKFMFYCEGTKGYFCHLLMAIFKIN